MLSDAKPVSRAAAWVEDEMPCRSTRCQTSYATVVPTNLRRCAVLRDLAAFLPMGPDNRYLASSDDPSGATNGRSGVRRADS